MTEQALPATPFPGEPGPGIPASTSEEVRRVLAQQIAAGELRPGQRLGAERELAAAGYRRGEARTAVGGCGVVGLGGDEDRVGSAADGG